MRWLHSARAVAWADALGFPLRFGLGSLFLYAGIAKALHPSGAVLAVHRYALLPGFLLHPVALGFTILEIAFGTLLILGFFTRFAAGGSAVLAGLFLVVLVQAQVRGLDIGCGCFGGNGAGSGVTWFDLLREPPILAGGLYLAGRASGPWRLESLMIGGRAARPAKRLRLLIPAALVVMVAVVSFLVPTLGGSSGLPQAAASEGVSINSPARNTPLPSGSKTPEFSASALGGGTISWSAYHGVPTVLALWAPWCPDCGATVPLLARVVGEFVNVRLVGIVTATNEQPGPTPTEFLQDHHLSFPVALDTGDERLADAFGVQGFPTIYYVKPDGTIQQVTVGVVPEGAMRALLQAISG